MNNFIPQIGGGISKCEPMNKAMVCFHAVSPTQYRLLENVAVVLWEPQLEMNMFGTGDKHVWH